MSDANTDDDVIDLTGETSQTPVAKSSGMPWWLPIAVIVVAFLWIRNQSQPAPQPDGDDVVIVDDQDQQQDPAPEPAPIDVKGSQLLFVIENTAPTAEQTEVMLSVTTESLKQRGFAGFRRYDDDQAEVQPLVEYAVSKNTPAPFIALVRKGASGTDVLKLASFPKSAAELEAFLR